MDFKVDNDDLLEDGELDDIVKADNSMVQGEDVPPAQGTVGQPDQGYDFQDGQITESQGDAGSDTQGDGNKQKMAGKQGNNAVGGKPSDGGRPGKKGMGALPKPPART